MRLFLLVNSENLLFRIEESRLLSESGDVYSFGVFLLELISGQEVSKISFSAPGESLIKWVSNHFLMRGFVIFLHTISYSECKPAVFTYYLDTCTLYLAKFLPEYLCVPKMYKCGTDWILAPTF